MPNARRARSIFINCPFDKSYKPIFDALIFTVFDCGFVARSALEIVNSATNRLDKISSIVAECDYAIHDISRTELDPKYKLPRFNMPFELGLFIGACSFGDSRQKRKNCLILDRQRFRYQKFLSDISGQDISEHRNSPRIASARIREWLCTVTGDNAIPGPSHIWKRYKKFEARLPYLASQLRLQPEEIRFKDFCNLTARWLQHFG